MHHICRPLSVRIQLTALAALFSMLSSTLAESRPPAPRWDKEPTSFLGVKFNVPLEAQLPTCEKAPSQLCYRKKGGGPASIENVPDIGVPLSDVKAMSFVGKVGTMYLHVTEHDTPFMLKVLESRYGPPHSESTRIIAMTGSTEPLTTYTWNGPHIQLSLTTDNHGYSGAAMLVISSHDVTKAMMAEFDEDARKAAEKL